MKLIKTQMFSGTSTVDYAKLSLKEKQRVVDCADQNISHLENTLRGSGVEYTFAESKKWSDVLPRRGRESPNGVGLQTPREFIDELKTSKRFNDWSGKQITAINHINEVLGECEELVDQLPCDTHQIVDYSHYQIEYKLRTPRQGAKPKRIYVKHYPNTHSQFNELFD